MSAGRSRFGGGLDGRGGNARRGRTSGGAGRSAGGGLGAGRLVTGDVLGAGGPIEQQLQPHLRHARGGRPGRRRRSAWPRGCWTNCGRPPSRRRGGSAVVLDAHPVETVRRCSGHDGWIPFAHDGGGHYLAVDMSPAAKGRAGQVIRIGRDYERGPAYEADSVTALLGRYLRLLDEGEYDVDEEDGWLELGIERAPEPPTSGVLESLPDATALEPSWQELTVNDARRTDLAVLRAAPRLRALALNRVTAADLGPLRDLPLEDAALGLDVSTAWRRTGRSTTT
ncbi:SMI1/KNR4 family protein [Actinomadura sp. NPDC047616]|uniref:SMI1/KNR4 family protein n=1 Tax=Actinomadura sp. NPDC047616 TaxID=3155914 RepID=UPI0033E826B1